MKMKITEQQIENIIYESPWLLDERYIIPKISGSRGENGRQINVGKGNSHFIDLLFKDTRDNRPVIIELKKGKVKRENIAQTLEYRALITSLNEESKDKWLAEFGQNYYAPKMLLIGSEADEDTILSANLAGVEIRTFGANNESEIGFDTFKGLQTKLREWNNFRNSGNRTLIEREDWIVDIIEKVSAILNEEFEEITTINKAYSVNGKKCYVDYIFPFLNLPIFYEEETLIGIYEYADEEFPFDEKYFYCDYSFLYEKEENEELNEKNISYIKTQMKKIGFNLTSFSVSDVPTLQIPREVVENETEFRKTIKFLVKNALEIFEKL
jgi:hypothetical protein